MTIRPNQPTYAYMVYRVKWDAETGEGIATVLNHVHTMSEAKALCIDDETNFEGPVHTSLYPVNSTFQYA